MLIKSNEQLLVVLDNLLREPQKFWNEFYDQTFEKIPFFINKPDENLVSYLEEKMIRPNKVLELGCGAGRNAIYLAKQGCSVVGVDLSDKALQWAQRRVDEANVNVELICANIFELNLQEESFDFIYDSGCFHHIAPHRRVTYIELIRKLLKPNGYFALCSFEEHGSYGGSAISDEEVYIKRSLEGGLGYTKKQLKEVFQLFEKIEIRNMIAMSDEDQIFGLEGFLVGLFKKNS
ncbi:methyltransferase [Lysinibacillus sphaericus]|uniref:class I SAM-dependent methyltransferase n=1 Tax=Lysinibacillus sphaericus TaxID=1421 RepID=UPI0018CFAFE1|nr:class I SAM-dependent methyltransferase [Lysinibacillus sphaericus]MBG9455607.1 methyltransferase [Lysinibacillus sphaericus]MBG9478024.1 methyltransferase [Lysinibacillus sphaericus]MBG9594164.1 methyltransferase [Lysinibacillus sphaericus]